MELTSFIRKYIHIFLIVAASVVLCACGNNRSYDQGELDRIKQMYAQAAGAQKAGDYDKALKLYDQLLHHRPVGKVCMDSLMPIVSKTITQTMNTMQSMGEPARCVEYLSRLKESDSLIVGNMCKRDISVVLAYAMSRTENIKAAAREMDHAMSMAPQLPTHDRLFRDYAFATAVYFCLPERKDDVYRYGEKALVEIAQCDDKSGESWLTAILAMAYTRAGDISNSISMFKQSYHNASMRGDSLAMANTLSLMAEILINWRLFGYANDFASKAVELSANVRGKNPMVSSNILAQKALVMQRFGYADSAMMYLGEAEKYAKDLPYNSGRSSIDLVRGDLLAKNASTHKKGMDMLRNVVNKGTSGLRTKAFFILAQEYLQHGEIARGEAAMDSMISSISINTSPVLRNTMYEYVLDYYVTTDNSPKMLWIARELNKKNLSVVATSDMLKQHAESIVDLNLQDATGEIDWQELKAENHRNLTFLYIIAMAVVIVSVTAALMALFRLTLLRRKSCDQQLEALSYKMQLAPSDNVQSYSSGMSKSRRALADKRYGEKKFYSSFERLHPHFLPKLRSIAPTVTRREELIAMLVALQVDRKQIESVMSMRRSTLAKTRYSLRRKIKLNRKDSLEYAISKILNK